MTITLHKISQNEIDNMLAVQWSNLLMPGTATVTSCHMFPFLDPLSSGLNKTNCNWVFYKLSLGVFWDTGIYKLFRSYFIV